MVLPRREEWGLLARLALLLPEAACAADPLPGPGGCTEWQRWHGGPARGPSCIQHGLALSPTGSRLQRQHEGPTCMPALPSHIMQAGEKKTSEKMRISPAHLMSSLRACQA